MRTHAVTTIMNPFLYTCIHTHRWHRHTQAQSIGSVPLKSPDSHKVSLWCMIWLFLQQKDRQDSAQEEQEMRRRGFRSNVPQNASDFLEGGLLPDVLPQNLSGPHLLIWIWLGGQGRAISSLAGMLLSSAMVQSQLTPTPPHAPGSHYITPVI